MNDTPRNPESRPRIVLAMIPGLERSLFKQEHLAALRAMATLPETEPAVPFDSERAGRLLQDAEILLTGWGCPELSAAVLDRAPRLRLIAHCAGTVKDMVTPACWERGLRVITAAEANAVPVVEYTVASHPAGQQARLPHPRDLPPGAPLRDSGITPHPESGT